MQEGGGEAGEDAYVGTIVEMQCEPGLIRVM